jgi:hypothetical protein
LWERLARAAAVADCSTVSSASGISHSQFAELGIVIGVSNAVVGSVITAPRSTKPVAQHVVLMTDDWQDAQMAPIFDTRA